MRPADLVARILILLREMEPMARAAGEADLLGKLKASRAAAADALERLTHAGP